jgi:hypothetical protein
MRDKFGLDQVLSIEQSLAYLTDAKRHVVVLTPRDAELLRADPRFAKYARITPQHKFTQARCAEHVYVGSFGIIDVWSVTLTEEQVRFASTFPTSKHLRGSGWVGVEWPHAPGEVLHYMLTDLCFGCRNGNGHDEAESRGHAITVAEWAREIREVAPASFERRENLEPKKDFGPMDKGQFRAAISDLRNREQPTTYVLHYFDDQCRCQPVAAFESDLGRFDKDLLRLWSDLQAAKRALVAHCDLRKA